ncbi:MULTISPECIES: beta galactosidase jelly roll domain-containing protein [unclassified Carboxylicivirga]|uniref:beta galactosidase jelly roll domain-containing protein n=1 Tax=Carboxylicivirga TaxID=1628153 RepID=UPI003D34A25B
MLTYTLRYLIIATTALCLNTGSLYGQILQEEQALEGLWKFSVGDNEEWKNRHFDDSNWESIRVPAAWQTQGYEGYNGFAWYRKTIRLDVLPQYDMVITLGRIDDADEVYINGRFVGKTGGLPPNIKTAYDKERRYTIPRSYWQKGHNVIAIRVYDYYLEGGIVSGPVKLYSDITSQLLSLDLSGTWKFAVHNQSRAEEGDYDDRSWSNIQVPGFWEGQGWDGYDGTAWYRKTFVLPDRLANEKLILLLGKIDDEDKTWINGVGIGGVSPHKLRSSLARGLEGTYESYTTLRAYKIPPNLLRSGSNTIAIRVTDTGIDGGIYQGPIGIMTEKQYAQFEENVHKEPDFWQQLRNWLNE